MKKTKLKLTRTVAVMVLSIAVVSTALSQTKESVDLNALAARGEALANQDPLAAELRDHFSEKGEKSRRGFAIGMGVADGHTAPGPGKDRICASLLTLEERRSCQAGVVFSVERNRYADQAAKGAAIAAADPAIAEARNSTPDAFYKLGFDIATAIFGDPALGAQGNTATGPGSLGIRDSLSGAGQRGFNDSAALNLRQRGVTTTNDRGVIDLNALAARGEAIANQDPLAVELRNQQPEGAGRRGFDIGMAAAEGHTSPGPGKDKVCALLSNGGRRERQPCVIAVLFSVDRNRYADRAAKGAAIAEADSAVAEARNATTDVFYKLGFDIATAIFGDPALGAQGNTAMGPGAQGIRDSLSASGQNGFNASMTFNLKRRGVPTNSSPTLPANSNVINEGPTDLRRS